MKALSLMPFWADQVLWGDKTIEVRTWQTDYRGDLLICSSSRRQSGFVTGCALCVVTLAGIEPFSPEHCEAAGFEPGEMPGKPSFAWHLEGLQWVEPFEVKGSLHLFDVPDDQIRLLEPFEDAADQARTLRDLFLPHVYFGKTDQAARDYWAEITSAA